jgi:hypothetical protein
MPQAVVSPPSAARDPKVVGVAVGGTAAAISTVADCAQQGASIAYSVSPIVELYKAMPIIFGVLAVAACAYGAYILIKRRKAGHS